MKELCPKCKEPTMTKRPHIQTIPVQTFGDSVVSVPVLATAYSCSTCGPVDVPRDRLDEGEVETSLKFIGDICSRYSTRLKEDSQ